MSRYLITQSLISAWLYTFTCYEECYEDAKQAFLDTLNREPRETTPQMQNGIDFENEVYKVVRGEPREPHPKWERGINAVATRLKGAKLQVRASRELVIGETTFVVYGIFDALCAGTIYDIKFLNKSFGSAELAGKYLDSPQHPAYFYCEPEAREFIYLVSDGDELYEERYTPEITRPFKDIVTEFIHSLDAQGLLDIYREKWKAKDDRTT